MPTVDVILGNPKTKKLTNASIFSLVDSGAGVCMCKESIVVWLQINLIMAKTYTFTAANNTNFTGKKIFMNMQVAGRIVNCPFFAVDDTLLAYPVILGQKGFFSQFKISFDYSNLSFEII